MEACVGAHHLNRTLEALTRDASFIAAKYGRPTRGAEEQFPDAEKIAEAVQHLK